MGRAERDLTDPSRRIRRFEPRRQPAIAPGGFSGIHHYRSNVRAAGRASAPLRRFATPCALALRRSPGMPRNVLLRLSGGLDSSIVLACLQAVPRRPRVLSYTQFISDSPLDPRRWARLAAAHSGGEHVEVESTAAGIRLDAILEMAPAAEPFSTLMCLVTAAHEQSLIARHGASATFTGDGGDCAFGSFCIGEAATAYLRRHGPRLAVVRLAAESASLLRQTTWHALTRALRMWLTGSLADEPRRVESRGSEVGEPTRSFRECETTPRGSSMAGRIDACPWEPISKLGMLLGTPDLTQVRHIPAHTGRRSSLPSIRKPLIELALRIPADVLFADGHDRGLARRAFRGDVPQPILNAVEGPGRRFPRRDHPAQPRLAARDSFRRRARQRRIAGQGSSRARAPPGLVKSEVFRVSCCVHWTTKSGRDSGCHAPAACSSRLRR